MKTGIIPWIDLTVRDAESVRDFYEHVVGWAPSPVRMGDYGDHCMNLPQEPGTAVAGICHARGENANLPPVWMVYLAVENLDRSLEACTSRAGKLIDGPKPYGNSARYAIIQDPAGAVAALFSEAPDPNPQ